MPYALVPSGRYKKAVLDAGDTIVDLGSPDPFPVLAAADIEVWRKRADARSKLTLDVDYAVTLLDQLPGARVTLAAPALQDDEIEAIGLRPVARSTDLQDGNRLTEAALNAEFDRLVLQQQEQRRDTDRAVKVDIGAEPPALPAPEDGRALIWNDDGDLVNGPTASEIAAAEEHAEAAQAAAGAADGAAGTAVAAAADAIAAATSVVPRDFASRAVAAASSVSALAGYVRTAGYAAAGDGGGALYSRAVAEPGHAGKFQSADGAWWELAETSVTPLMFGAAADGVTIDDTAMQACLMAAAFLGRPVRLPARTIQLGAKLTVAGALDLSGEHLENSVLRWTAGAATRGIEVTLDDQAISAGLRNTCRVSNLSLFSAGDAGPAQRALAIKDTSPLDRMTPSVMIDHVYIRGSTHPNHNGWDIGIFMDGCQGAWIDAVHIGGKVGAGGSPSYDTAYGIYYANSSGAAPHPSECQITNSTIKHCTVAIYADDMEGLVVSDCQIVGVGTGVSARGAVGYPHVSVQNNHINASGTCVLVDLMYEAIIAGNLLYNQSHLATATGINVINGAQYFNIHGNTFENYSEDYSANLIVVSNGENGLISGNIFRRADATDGSADGTAIWLTASAINVYVADDNVFASVERVNTTILNQGAGNRVPANTRPGASVTPQMFVTSLSADRSGADSSTAQAIFDAANDAVTFADFATVRFRASIVITRSAGTTSHTTGFLFGGTATISNVSAVAHVSNPTGNVLGAVSAIEITAATETVLTAANTSATENVRIQIEGVMRIAGGGTVIPQFKYSAAPGGAPTVRRNSFFECWRVGSSSFTTAGWS